jgi:hypothetical protein
MGKDRNKELQNMLGIYHTLFSLFWTTLNFLLREKFMSLLLFAEIYKDCWELFTKGYPFLTFLYMKAHYLPSNYTS